MPRKKKCNIDRTLKKYIYRGGYGYVYLNPRGNIVKAATSSMKNEFTIMKLLKHLNFIPYVYCYETYNALKFLEMQYIEGMDLSTYFTEYVGKIPIDETLKFIIEISRKIKLIHENGYAHLDIKLNNFILKDQIYVLDFGNTQKLTGTLDHLVINELICNLPEIGKKHTSKEKIDVYCLCSMFKLMLEYSIRSVKKGKLHDIIDKGLHMNPDKRINLELLILELLTIE